MARTNMTAFTPEELTALLNWAAQFDLPFDSTAIGEENQTFIKNYFIETWKEDCTLENLQVAEAMLTPHLKANDPAGKETFADYWSNLTSNEKEEAFLWKPSKAFVPTVQNYNVLYQALATRGMRVTRENLTWAAGRFANELQWDSNQLPKNKPYHQAVAEARGVDKSDTDMLGPDFSIDLQGLHGARLESAKAHNAAYFKRKDAEARNRSEDKPENATTRLARENAKAKREAEELRGYTHAENDELSRMFVMIKGTHDVDWPATNQARKNQQALQRSRRQSGLKDFGKINPEKVTL